MNQFQLNRHYIILSIISLSSINIISAQGGNNDDNSTALNDSSSTLEFTTTARQQELAMNTTIIDDKPTLSDPIDDIFIKPQQNIFIPTPTSSPSPPLSISYYSPQYINYQLPPTSNKLFEFSLKKKIFPFAGFSLDIKRYNDQSTKYLELQQLQHLQLQQQKHPHLQYHKPQHTTYPLYNHGHITNSPNLTPSYGTAITVPLKTNVFITKKPNHFNNIFHKNYDWGEIIRLPGKAIQKFTKIGFNVFGGSTQTTTTLNNHYYGIGNTNNNGNSNGLITGQMPPYGLIDERITSKVA